MDIRKLLKPNKIAVVGASDKEGFGGDTCRNMMAYMDESDYYFVNPKRESVLGKKAYPSITALPEPVDLVILCTPQTTIEGLLREAAAKGAKAAVIYASGYGEVGTENGRQAEEALGALCAELDMAIMGPNCAGFVNYIDNRHGFAFISETRDRTGRVGVVSQSGQLVLSMMDSPSMTFSYVISAGNSTVVQMEDYLDFLVDDPDTKVVAMYLEGVKSPGKFVQALKKAAEQRKPVVILKSGRSAKGQALAASHTGSLSGADKTYDALFEKFGVIRVDDLEELMSTARALATLTSLPTGKGVAAISLSGGETGICADLGEQMGVTYPDFSASTLAALKAQLPSYATPNNPLDSTATLSYDTDLFAKVLGTIMQDAQIDMVVVGYTLLQEIADPAIKYMSAAMAQVSQEHWAKPMVMLPFTENTRNAPYSDQLTKIGVPVLPTSLYGFKIIANILRYATYRSEDHDLQLTLDKPAAQSVGGGALTESQSKGIVRSYGVPTGDFAVANSADEAVALFVKFGKVPVVAKIDSPDILHKSDAGCVKLSLRDEEMVRTAYDTILANARRYDPTARLAGVQICVMAPAGIEMIVGVNNDPDFGPTILCGMGGVFVEIFQDVALGLAPLSKTEALHMIRSLKAFKLLEGYRGGAKGDVDALAELLVNVSQLAIAHQDEMKELDINPVMVYEKGLCAVDALYVQK